MQHALEMGAVLQADLTSDVTHLIVARLQTDKYKFAARHRTDIKLMTVDWIPAIHTIWINGKDVNLYESEDKCRLPIFHGLRICVTNLDVDVRMQIERIVLQNGGQYTGDLTKENTHLIAGSATGKKWEAVNAWQCDICIVGVEWIYESVKRGASLDEKYFRLELSAEIRGQSSWFPPRVAPKLIEDFAELETTGDKRRRLQGQQISRKRATKRNSTFLDDGLWSEILDGDPVNQQQTLVSQQEDLSVDLPVIELDLPSHHIHDLNQEVMPPSRIDILSNDLTAGIFDQLSFYITGFALREDQIVRRTVLSNGGRILDTEAMDGYHIVPQNGCPPISKVGANMVTEFWLERCKMVGVTDYALDGILGSQCRIDASVALKQRRSTLLRGIVCHIARSCGEAFGRLLNLAQSMGARLAENTEEGDLTHYVGGHIMNERVLGAGVHVVSEAWLVDTFTLANRQLESSYPLPLKDNDENVPPGLDKTENDARRGAAPSSNQKLTSEMNEIRKRINTGPVRRTSRKILGRATTLPCTENVTVMMTTDMEETLERNDGIKAASQGITYSDPETLEKQRVLMRKLGALQNGTSSNPSLNEHATIGGRASMRAIGLDDVRKLRR
ncbi:S-M checkpoint control protein rad45 / FY16936)) [Taphrina deformans PYCC 5710]|uniref:S-M checkpoint control protein rad45 / FY16936 n=1 Tax=Taphrina deformans (strain PYCC 5710 / ATCC 11124 / CBS 356.35 / IMI 108563 / JCM 9778 / NBRC 8474) TaxID=1097556 RepID=R4XAV7_TAPDE|nr:S-M checkpoint control protein rad45 / FY16936)) [Taphrina deformans PYCC 5710]|eukprot:CCG82684.1 S-M checkpoint control protein rad45 / FY16936)) [Taphrina deformans PYCC 5710]